MSASTQGGTLACGGGGDRLSGGSGGDTFIFTSIADSLPGSSDVITDFSGSVIMSEGPRGRPIRSPGEGDIIDLSAIDADVNTAGDQEFTLARKFTGEAGQAYSSYDSTTGITSLFLDVDGDAVADATILFEGQVNFTGGDFIW